MERINKIYHHPCYQEAYQKLQKLEEERIFCGRSMVHFLDVPRLIYIYSLEEQVKIDKEAIYAVALLHDIGRHEQYLYGTAHQYASARISEEILPECGFDEKEQKLIIEAILSHRNKDVVNEKSLRGFLYRADKASRSCFSCSAQEECNWAKEKKNMEINY